MDSNNKRIAKNTLFLYLRMAFVMCIQLYTSRVVLETLGVEDYGIYGVVGGVVVMFSSALGSLGAATSRFFTVELGRNDYKQLEKVFSNALMLHVLMAIVIVVCCETIGLWFLNTKMTIPDDRLVAANWVLQFSIFTTMFSITQVPYNAAIIAHERMDVYAYIGLVEVILKLLIVYLIQVSPADKLISYGFLLMLLQIVVVMSYRIYCIKSFPETRFRCIKDKRLLKSMLSYSAFDTIGALSVMLQGQGLNMILNVFCGPVVNAARAISYQIQGAINQFSGNFLTAVNPQIIKYYAQGKLDKMMTLVKRSSILAYTLMLLLIVPLSLNIDFILNIWLINVPKYTGSFTIIILVVSLLNAFRRPRITAFHATGNIKLSNMVTGGILCMAFPIGYIFMVLDFSPNSVFWGMLATTVIADITNLLILKRYIDYSVVQFLKDVHLPCLFITFATLLCTVPFNISLGDGWLKIVSTTLLSSVVILAMAWKLALTSEQRHKFISALHNRWNKL